MVEVKGFIEFMNEESSVNRWFMIKIALFGGFCGALLGVFISIAGMAG